MIGIPIKKHLKLRYQEEGRTCRTCSDRRKNEGICIKKNRTNDIGGISSFYFYFPFGILEVIRQDYIRTARSKGIANNKVIYLHALKNALIPVITILGMRLGNLIAGSMFVESVFNFPGMGSLMVKAIQSRDIPVVQACVLAIALVSCIVNLATDILYAVVDPRVRFE